MYDSYWASYGNDNSIIKSILQAAKQKSVIISKKMIFFVIENFIKIQYNMIEAIKL